MSPVKSCATCAHGLIPYVAANRPLDEMDRWRKCHAMRPRGGDMPDAMLCGIPACGEKFPKWAPIEVRD